MNIDNQINQAISGKDCLHFFPKYCQRRGYTWDKMFRLGISSKNSVFTFPNEIVILVSSFIMKITLGEYQYYLDTLHYKLRNLKFYADSGNRLSFNYTRQKITDILKSLKSKIGEDIETNGLYLYVLTKMKKIVICTNTELEYDQLRIKHNLQRIEKYSKVGNKRMVIFFKKITQDLINKIDPSKIELLEQIQISQEKEESFKKLEINLTIQKVKKYANLGDRNTMTFYKRKLLDLVNNTDTTINIRNLDGLLTIQKEQQFLRKQLFKFLDYAEDKSKLKDHEGMERYLLKSQKYYQRLLSLSIIPDFQDNMENRIKRINEIFNCPL